VGRKAEWCLVNPARFPSGGYSRTRNGWFFNARSTKTCRCSHPRHQYCVSRTEPMLVTWEEIFSCRQRGYREQVSGLSLYNRDKLPDGRNVASRKVGTGYQSAIAMMNFAGWIVRRRTKSRGLSDRPLEAPSRASVVRDLLMSFRSCYSELKTLPNITKLCWIYKKIPLRRYLPVGSFQTCPAFRQWCDHPMNSIYIGAVYFYNPKFATNNI